MENVNRCQFTAHVKVSVGGAKLSGELKQHTHPVPNWHYSILDTLRQIGCFILVHLATFSELHLHVGYIIPFSESHSSCQGSLRSVRWDRQVTVANAATEAALNQAWSETEETIFIFKTQCVFCEA